MALPEERRGQGRAGQHCRRLNLERQEAAAVEQGDPPFICLKFLLLCFLSSPSVCPSVCPCPHGDSGMVMHSVCIICGLTSTDDSGEDLKESRVRKPGLRDSSAVVCRWPLAAPILGNESQPLAPLCSLCPLLPTRAPVSVHPPCPGKAGAVSDVSHTTRGAGGGALQ